MTVRTVHLKKKVQSPAKAVLDILHDPTALSSLSPLCESITGDPTYPQRYIITENVPVLGLYHTKTTFTCVFENVEDGVNTSVDAGSTKLRGKWRVQEIEGVSNITEDVEVEVSLSYACPTHFRILIFCQTPFLLSWFVTAVMTKAHQSVIDRLGDRVTRGPV